MSCTRCKGILASGLHYLLSFPVLALTGSGKIWLVQNLEVCSKVLPAGATKGESEGGGNGPVRRMPLSFHPPTTR